MVNDIHGWDYESDVVHNSSYKIDKLTQEVELLFEKVASLRESIIKLEQNSQNRTKS